MDKKLLLENEYSKIELEDDIIIITWKSLFIDLPVMKQIVNNRLKVTGDKKYPVLVKIKSIKDSTKEARDFLASEQGAKNVLAVAIHVDSIFENMIASLFIYLNKPIVPVQIFKDEEKAKEWLVQYVVEV